MHFSHICSRRAWLRQAGGAAGSLVLWPVCLSAASGARERLRFCVISDTHLGYRGQDAAERQWRATAGELARAGGEFVLHLGDVVDGGREPQYPVYVGIRNTIGKPVYEVPGNHDPQELFERHLRRPADTVVEHRWLRILLLNNTHPDSHDGFLAEKQLTWIDEQCRGAGQSKLAVLLCMHVPAHENRHPDRGWYVKPQHGQKEFYEILRRHQDRVLAVFHGHFHNGIRGWEDHAPVHEVCFPSALYNQDRRLEEQQAPGYNPQEFRPGFTLVDIHDQTIRLQYKPLGAEVAVEKDLMCPQAVSPKA